MRQAVALALLVALSCAPLADLPAGVCGNGVVEAGELCDSWVDPALGHGVVCAAPDAGARACLYVCDPGRCPAGWGCGRDGICRQPTGAFGEGRRWGMSSEALVVADLDADGHADLVGSGAGKLDVRYGGAGGELEPVHELPTGGGSLVLRRGEEGTLLASVSPLGLVFLRPEADRTLGALAFATLPLVEDEAGWPVAVPEPDGSGDALWLFTQPTGAMAELHRVALPFVGDAPSAPLPFSLDRVAALTVTDIDGDGAAEVVVPEIGSRTIHILRRDGAEGVSVAQWVVGIDVEDRIDPRAPLVVDLDADGRAELLVSVAGRVWAAGEAGSGWDPRFDALAEEARFPLAAGDLDVPADGAPDFVLPGGIYRALPAGLALRAAFSAPATEAVVADLDANGTLDVVAAGAAPTLEVFYSNGALTPLDVPLGGPARALESGDFDGHGPVDLAFVERSDDTHDRLRAAFGWAGGSPDIVTVGTLDRVEHVARADVQVVPSVGRDGATDLLVVTRSPAGTRGTAVLGAANRALEAPLILQADNRIDEPHRVLLGALRPGRGTEAVAIAEDANGRGRHWLVSPFADPVASAPTGLLPEGVSGECGAWRVGDVDGDGFDEIVGATRAVAGCGDSVLVMLDASLAFESPGSPMSRREWSLAEGARSLALDDLDGDGAADVALLGAGDLEVRWGPDFDQIARLPAPPGALALTAIRADVDPGQELAVLGAGSLTIVDFRADRRLAVRAPAGAPSGEAVTAADVDGDGLEDLLVSAGSEVVVLPAVSR